MNARFYPGRWLRPLALLAAGLTLLVACDQRRISRLEEGVSTEADVRREFGEPAAVWDEPGGARTLEYNRNPQGWQNYMITIGPDGRMAALRQVLHPTYFAKVQPGMAMEQVRRLLGQPARRLPLPLKGEEAWEWRYIDPPNTQMVFTVWFDRDWRVARTGSELDPEAPPNRR